MDIATLATAQNELDAAVAELLDNFKTDYPDVSLSSINIDLWSSDGAKVTSSVSALIDGARISRTTEQV